MFLPALIPAAIAALASALVVFVKVHAAHITARAAFAAAREFINSHDADLAAEAALQEGLSATSMHLVQDFFRVRLA